MSWLTIYIHGKTGFKESVESRLDDGWLRGNPETESGLMMYWLPEAVSLREFKLAIGSKTIFKYRLQFFTTVDEYLKEKNRNQHSGFSAEENRMVRKMVNWQKRNRTNRKSTLRQPAKKQKV